jgi:hypothetical protein
MAKPTFKRDALLESIAGDSPYHKQPFAQLRHQLCHTSLESRGTGPRAFAGFLFCPLLI